MILQIYSYIQLYYKSVIHISVILQFTHFICCVVLLQALKVLRTAEFLPYVVFIEAPNFEVLKDMNRSAIEAGVVTKQLTVISVFNPLRMISSLNVDKYYYVYLI